MNKQYLLATFIVLTLVVNAALLVSTFSLDKNWDAYCADKNIEGWVYHQASFIPGQYPYEKTVINPSKICPIK